MGKAIKRGDRISLEITDGNECAENTTRGPRGSEFRDADNCVEQRTAFEGFSRLKDDTDE